MTQGAPDSTRPLSSAQLVDGTQLDGYHLIGTLCGVMEGDVKPPLDRSGRKCGPVYIKFLIKSWVPEAEQAPNDYVPARPGEYRRCRFTFVVQPIEPEHCDWKPYRNEQGENFKCPDTATLQHLTERKAMLKSLIRLRPQLQIDLSGLVVSKVNIEGPTTVVELQGAGERDFHNLKTNETFQLFALQPPKTSHRDSKLHRGPPAWYESSASGDEVPPPSPRQRRCETYPTPMSDVPSPVQPRREEEPVGNSGYRPITAHALTSYTKPPPAQRNADSAPRPMDTFPSASSSKRPRDANAEPHVTLPVTFGRDDIKRPKVIDLSGPSDPGLGAQKRTKRVNRTSMPEISEPGPSTDSNALQITTPEMHLGSPSRSPERELDLDNEIQPTKPTETPTLPEMYDPLGFAPPLSSSPHYSASWPSDHSANGDEDRPAAKMTSDDEEENRESSMVEAELTENVTPSINTASASAVPRTKTVRPVLEVTDTEDELPQPRRPSTSRLPPSKQRNPSEGVAGPSGSARFTSIERSSASRNGPHTEQIRRASRNSGMEDGHSEARLPTSAQRSSREGRIQRESIAGPSISTGSTSKPRPTASPVAPAKRTRPVSVDSEIGDDQNDARLPTSAKGPSRDRTVQRESIAGASTSIGSSSKTRPTASPKPAKRNRPMSVDSEIGIASRDTRMPTSAQRPSREQRMPSAQIAGSSVSAGFTTSSRPTFAIKRRAKPALEDPDSEDDLPDAHTSSASRPPRKRSTPNHSNSSPRGSAEPPSSSQPPTSPVAHTRRARPSRDGSEMEIDSPGSRAPSSEQRPTAKQRAPDEPRAGPSDPRVVLRRQAEAKVKAAAEARLREQEQQRHRLEADVKALLEPFTASNGAQYNRLSISDGYIVNVMGCVVKEPDPPKQTKGGDFLINVVIGDPETHAPGKEGEDMVVTIFRKAEDELPSRLQPGTPIMFRKIKVKPYENKPKGNAASRPEVCWVTLTSDRWKSSFDRMDPPLSIEEKERMKTFDKWWKMMVTGEVAAHVDSSIGYIDEGRGHQQSRAALTPSIQGKRMLLSQVTEGRYFDAYVKIMSVVWNRPYTPAVELYITDGTLSADTLRNYHDIQVELPKSEVKLPPNGLFKLSIFNEPPEEVIKLLVKGNVLKIANMRCTRYDGGLELIWSEMMTSEQKEKGWKNKKLELVSRDHYEVQQINTRLNLLKKGELPAAPGSGVQPNSDLVFARYIATIHDDPTCHPFSTIKDILTNSTHPNRFKLQARVKSIHARSFKAGDSYVQKHCKRCKKQITSMYCKKCKDTELEDAEWRYRFVAILEEPKSGPTASEAATLPILIGDDEAALFLPGLPPLGYTGNPNDERKDKERLRGICEEVDKLLLGAKMDGKRPRPVYDWTIESYELEVEGANAGQLPIVYRAFGMRANGLS